MASMTRGSTRTLGVVAAGIALTASGTAGVSASAAPASSRGLSGISRPSGLTAGGSLPRSGTLLGVAAISARSAWAVGQTGSGKTLIAGWNGTTWKQQASPAPGAGSLVGVAAVSARNVWAVGHSGTGTSTRILILRWNGTV
jgi:hypothetical protein